MTGGAESAERKQELGRLEAGGGDLQSAAQNWPTLSASDWKGLGPTLERSDGKMRGDRLDYATEQLWSTPRASDGEKGGPNQSFGAGGIPLAAQSMQWATPSVADTTGGRMSRSGDRSNEPLLKGQAANLMDQWPTPTSLSFGDSHQPGNSRSYNLTMELAKPISSLPVHPIYTVGGIPSKERRSLNPLFVEFLMGWPPGWTLLAWTDFACSATALSAFKQRMRFALSQLALPPPAPLVQRDLFG